MAKLDAKKVIVDEIKQRIGKSKSVIFVNYKGVKVSQDTKLRKSFREAGCDYKVYKNRLLVIALKELGISGYDTAGLEGTTSVIFDPEETTAAGILGKAITEFKALEAKFGILNGAVIDAAGVMALTRIPSKEVLISMLMGMLQAPVSALARALNEISKKAQ